MDFIRKYDIELEKEQYYAGELLRGWVVIENAENLRITGVHVYLRGKAHVEWRITRGGERRTVKEDQYFIDEKSVVWGNAAEVVEVENLISILEQGDHRLPFEFQLPDRCIPCSFESRVGTIRYYVRVIIDIPYASQPQGLKYFTVIGQEIDCFSDTYMRPLAASRQLSTKCSVFACTTGPLSLDACLERTAYCCTEFVRLNCDVTNGTDQDVTLFCRLLQNVEYRINKGPLGLSKDITHQILEYRSPTITPHSVRGFHDLHQQLQVPVMPPTLTDVCRIIEIFYVLKVIVHMEKSGEDLQLEFPFVVATVPCPDNDAQLPQITYEPADDHVEGGIYISPEFQLGQVYDGAADVMEDVILYRPVYVCVASQMPSSDLNNGHSPVIRDSSKSGRDRRKSSPKPIANSANLEHVNNGHSPISNMKKTTVRQKSNEQHQQITSSHFDSFNAVAESSNTDKKIHSSPTVALTPVLSMTLTSPKTVASTSNVFTSNVNESEKSPSNDVTASSQKELTASCIENSSETVTKRSTNCESVART